MRAPATICLLFSIFLFTGSQQDSKKERPNILDILADDQGAYDLSYGNDSYPGLTTRLKKELFESLDEMRYKRPKPNPYFSEQASDERMRRVIQVWFPTGKPSDYKFWKRLFNPMKTGGKAQLQIDLT